MRYQAPTYERPAEMFLHGPIGRPGVTAARMKADLAAARRAGYERALVRVDSPGGCLVEALELYHLFRAYGVDAHVEGEASSGAGLAIMGCRRVTMSPNAVLMLHDPQFVWRGDVDLRRALAEAATRARFHLAVRYSNRSGQSVQRILQLMDAESVLTAEAAVRLGFADAIAATTGAEAR